MEEKIEILYKKCKKQKNISLIILIVSAIILVLGAFSFYIPLGYDLSLGLVFLSIFIIGCALGISMVSFLTLSTLKNIDKKIKD